MALGSLSRVKKLSPKKCQHSANFEVFFFTNMTCFPPEDPFNHSCVLADCLVYWPSLVGDWSGLDPLLDVGQLPDLDDEGGQQGAGGQGGVLLQTLLEQIK